MTDSPRDPAFEEALFALHREERRAYTDGSTYAPVDVARDVLRRVHNDALLRSVRDTIERCARKVIEVRHRDPRSGYAETDWIARGIRLPIDRDLPPSPPPEPPAVLDDVDGLWEDYDALIESRFRYVRRDDMLAADEVLRDIKDKRREIAAALTSPDRDGETDAEIRRRVERHAWSFIRQVLVQGQAQRQDYDAGKYTDFEDFSARIDEAARERVPMLADVLCPGGTDG